MSPKTIFKLNQKHNTGLYWHAEVSNLNEGCIYGFRIKQKNSFNNNYEKSFARSMFKGITGWGSYKRKCIKNSCFR